MSRAQIMRLKMTLAAIGGLTLAMAGLILGTSSAKAAGPPEAAKEAIETIVVELGPDGFYPKEIRRRTAGKFYIFMRVNVSQEPLTLRLENEAGAALKQANLPNLGKRWGQLIDVQAGKYFVRVPGKSNMVLNITVP